MRGRVDGNGAYAGDNPVLPQEVAPDDPPVDFGYDRVDVAAREQRRYQSLRNLRRGEIGWEVVLVGYGLERLVADRAAPLGVLDPPGS